MVKQNKYRECDRIKETEYTAKLRKGISEDLPETRSQKKQAPEEFLWRRKQDQEKKELRDLLKIRKDAYAKQQARVRQQQADNKERKAENEVRSGTYETIKNPEKIKKWKVKARRLVRNIPKDIFYKKYFNRED